MAKQPTTYEHIIYLQTQSVIKNQVYNESKPWKPLNTALPQQKL